MAAPPPMAAPQAMNSLMSNQVMKADRFHGRAENIGGPASGVIGSVFGNGSGGAIGSLSGVGGGVYRASDAFQEGDVSTNAFDDFFEYALTAPVTIHKNESAMVPILQQESACRARHALEREGADAAARGVAGKQIQAHPRLRQLLHL